MRLAQSYHAFDSSAPVKAEISGLMECLPMPAESRHLVKRRNICNHKRHTNDDIYC